MNRRELLGSAAVTTLLASCDRLVLLDREGGEGTLSAITPVGTFYVYQRGQPPVFLPEQHRISIEWDGAVTTLDAADLSALPARDVELTLQCIGHSPSVVRIGNATWGGLPLSEVLDGLGLEVPAEAVGLRLVGVDGYDAGVPVDAPLWLAWRMNGEPLPFEHGAPARLLAPGRYGVKWIKWVKEIAFVREPHVSFWTTRGWDEEALNQPNTLVVTPPDGSRLTEGEQVGFVGAAFAGDDPVASVEVSVDGGDWQPAQIDYEGGTDVWVIWSWSWTAVQGEHTVQVRATTEGGRTTSPDPQGTDPLVGYDGSMLVQVDVA